MAASPAPVNVASIAPPAGTNDNTGGNNSSTANTTINAQANLAISKTDGIGTVNAGAATTYAIVVSNGGPANADGAIFTDPAEEIVTPVDTPMDPGTPDSARIETAAKIQLAPAATTVKPMVEITMEMANSVDSLKPTETELNEVGEYKVGTWLQMPKADGGYQQLKVGWVSGISGSIMFVNRRGARVMVLSPPELVSLRRRNDLLLFEDELPVDQAMTQLLEKLKRQ